jgi:hypothetical protein
VLLLEAYHKEYAYGRTTRHAVYDDDKQQWDVIHLQWQPNGKAKIIGQDAKSYKTEAEAIDASGEQRDVYRQRFQGSREQRLDELRRLSLSCEGGPRTSMGLVPLLTAILSELQSLGAQEDKLKYTRSGLDLARRQLEESKWNRRQE